MTDGAADQTERAEGSVEAFAYLFGMADFLAPAPPAPRLASVFAPRRAPPLPDTCAEPDVPVSSAA